MGLKPEAKLSWHSFYQPSRGLASDGRSGEIGLSDKQRLMAMGSAKSKKRVLFVCRENRVRSRTAEQVYRGRPDLEVRSAGIAEHAAVPLTPELFDWADLVFVFSKRQKRVIEARFGDRSDRKRIVCLRLPDRFEYKSSKLVMELTGRLGPYLGAPANEERAAAEEPSVEPVAKSPSASSNRDTASSNRGLLGLLSGLVHAGKPLLGEPST